MKETSFIQQNKEKWKEFEDELKSEYKDPDKLSNILIQITDDLSYSRTFYPNRSVKVYLNNIAQQIFQSIYKNKKEKRKKIFSFWSEELPLLAYKCRIQLLISFLVFVFAVAIGVLSCIYDKEFAGIILGDLYVKETIENIEKGDPMAIYKDSNQVDMFLYIAPHNLLVAFRTFITGLFLSVGTLLVLVYNGIMVGAFQYFFYDRGLFLESFLTIWLHGTIEISSIIIAGASGLVLGKGLVFPGTYSRLQAFQVSAKQGLKLFIGIVPLIVFAALIEGFITRYTEVPNFVKALLIFVSLAFVIFYFIYYPYVKFKSIGNNNTFEASRLQPYKNHKIDIKVIKTNSDIFKDIFTFYRQRFRFIVLASAISAIVFVGVALYLFKNKFFQTDNMYQFYDKILWFFNYSETPLIYVLNTLFIATLTYSVSFFLIKELKDGPQSLISLYKPILILGLLNCVFWLPVGLAILLLVFCLPFFLLWSFVSLVEDINVFVAFSRCLKLLSTNFGKLLGLHIMLTLISLIFLVLMISPVIYTFSEAVEISIYMDYNVYIILANILYLFASALGVSLVFPILIVGQGILYFSLKEITEAFYLRERISKLIK